MSQKNQKENRAYPRHKISLPVEYKTMSPKKYFYTVSKDISLSGINLIVEDSIAMNSQVKLNVNLINKIIPLEARVIWCHKQREAHRHYIGLEFSGVNSSLDNELLKFIE
ncbi:MAG: PilZ domain-containing protein [Candidatus Omnitrophica bacterium]|nr:PilZ domain-containing protein [Candidatus Omnitrophota bacterium]